MKVKKGNREDSEANKQKQTLQIKNITKNLIYFTYLSYVYTCLTVS